MLNGFKLENWIPMLPWEGPPLPRFLNFYWFKPAPLPIEGSAFFYTSALRSSATTTPEQVRVRAEVNIRNRGNAPGRCAARLQYRSEAPFYALATEWEDAQGIGTVEAIIQPGQIITFWDNILLPVSAIGARLDLRFIGDPGEIHGQIVIPPKGTAPGEPGYGVLVRGGQYS